MATDMFLKIEGPAVDGESADSSHEKEIDVLSWAWGMDQSGTMHTSSGGGAGKVQVHDMTIVKKIDAATPNLMKHCASGSNFEKATLVCRKAGGEPLEYLKIEMNGVIITHVSAAGQQEDVPSEEVRLNFAEFITTYDPQDAAGAGAGAITGGWNIATSVEAG